MKPRTQDLVILTTHFGTNFSGGSLATCEIFSRIQDHFNKIVVVGTELGKHTFRTLEFIQYKNWLHAVRQIKRLAKSDVVFYGDFYNSFLFIWAKVPFYFTYHDNWPEMRKFGLKNRIDSFFYTPVYKRVFRRASHVFSVSDFKMKFIGNYTTNVSVVRNGFSASRSISSERRTNVLMVGNIDRRKYAKAISFFQYLGNDGEALDFKIDIYGRVNDREVARELSKFNFVRMMGFTKDIPYGQYKALLHTSLMENLPIVFCEALHHQTPVITFDVGGASEIVKDGQGILIRPYALKDLRSALLTTQGAGCIGNFHGEVPEEYSWNYCSQKYLEKITSDKTNS